MTILARARVVLEGDTVRLTKALQGAEKAMQQAGERMSSIGTKLTAGLTIPIAGLGAVLGRAFIGFESSFAGIRKTMDLTEAEFQQLEAANRGLAKSIPVSVNELNRIGELAGQLGIRGVANVVKFEDTIAKLAVTTDLTADQGALAFAQIANVMQLPQDQIDRLGSAVVGLGNNFATVESQIVEFTTRIAGAGQIAGLSAGDVAGIGTAFASLGVNAEAGGTAVQKVLIEMVTAASQGGEKLGVFARTAGLSAEGFRRAFEEDAAGAFVRFVEGLGRQGTAAIGTLETLGLTDQRLTRSFLAAAGAGDLLSRAVARGNAEFEANTALTDEASKRFQTAESRLRLFWNRIKDVSITLGGAFVPVLTDALDTLQPVIDVLGRAAEGFARLPGPVRLGVALLAGLAAAAGPVIVAIGAVTSAAAAAAPVLATVAGVLAGPVGLAIAAVGALLAAGALVWRRWGEQIKLVAGAVLAVVRERIQPVVEFIRAAFRAIVAASVWLHENAIRPVIAFVRQAIEWLVGRLGAAIAAAGRVFVRLARVLVPGLAAGIDGVVRFVDDVRAKMAEMQSAATDAAAETSSALEDVAGAATAAAGAGGAAAGPPPWMAAAQEASQQLTAALRQAAQMNTLLGDSFDLTGAQADAYRGAVEALVQAGVPLDAQVPGIGMRLRELANTYLDLQAGIDAAAQKERERAAAISLAQQAVAATITPAERYAEIQRALEVALASGTITQEQFTAALRNARDALHGVDDAMREFRSLIEQSLTPAQAYEATMARLRLLLEQGRITQEQFNQAAAQAGENLEQASRRAETVGQAFGRIGSQGLDAVAAFATGSKDAIRNFVQDALRQLARLLVRIVAIRFLTAAFPGLAAAGALPGFARGGFLQGGGIGVVGERGPELVQAGRRGLSITPMGDEIVARTRPPGVSGAAAARAAGGQAGGGQADVAAIIGGVLERVGAPPGPLPPEVAATHDWYRRLFSEAALDAGARGVRFPG